MTLVALHLLLALLWAMASGSITLLSLAVGLVIGYLVLAFASPALGDPRYVRRARRVAGLAAFFLYELLVSSVRVAIDVVRPRLTMQPAVVAVPLSLDDDAAITVLANLVSLTPGTLSIDVSPDRAFLYVHAMYGTDPGSIRRSVHSFERRVAEAFA
jgi:multicomponent Na+:H+ antiporter subunit E